MANIQFRSLAVAVPRDSNAGVLQTDPHGYARMCIGGLNTLNSRGEYYEATDEVVDLFTGSSLLQLQVKNNALYGENGHPSLIGMNDRDATARFMTIYEPNVCTHFKGIYLDTEYYKTSPTMQKGEIAIMAELKPYGDKQEVVAEAFANPFMNLSYSIRCITQPRNVAGRIHRIIKSIITFDKVYMPGIKHASKQNALLATTSEAYVIDEINKAGMSTDINTLATIIEEMQQSSGRFSTECVSTALGVFDEVRRHLDNTGESYNRVDSVISMFRSM